MKKQGLICLILTLFLSNVYGQKDLKTALEGKKWGLYQFKEAVGTSTDTLFTVRDCGREYLMLTETEYEYVSGVKYHRGTWSVNKDSILTLLKKNGKILVQCRVMRIDDKNMTIMEAQRLNIFIHEYQICTEKDTLVSDTREAYPEKLIDAITIGAQTSQTSNLLEFGYTRAKISWNQNVYLMQFIAEANAWNSNLTRDKTIVVPDSIGQDYVIQVPRENVYGLQLNFMTQKWLAFGAGISAHTNMKTVLFGVRPIMGISFKFLGDVGALSHLVYGYNFLFLKDGYNKIIDDLNRHSVSLRISLPVKKRHRTIRKIIFFDE